VEDVSTTYPYPGTNLIDSLRELKDVYVDAVNRAVADDRDDLVRQLVDEYGDEALKLMSRVLPAAA
jgi:hypothetical protein